MFVLVNGRQFEVGDRQVVRGSELRAEAEVAPGDDLWEVVFDPEARRHDAAAPSAALHDEAVHDDSVIRLARVPFRAERFFTSARSVQEQDAQGEGGARA